VLLSPFDWKKKTINDPAISCSLEKRTRKLHLRQEAFLEFLEENNKRAINSGWSFLERRSFAYES
jgi:hypothetical protein